MVCPIATYPSPTSLAQVYNNRHQEDQLKINQLQSVSVENAKLHAKLKELETVSAYVWLAGQGRAAVPGMHGRQAT